MRLPAPDDSHERRAGMGRYLGRRLRRAGYTELAATVDAATRAVKVAGRAWEDASDPLQDALADRDAADDDLDLTAQESRLALAARGIAAMRERPYTDIFHRGLDYYTVAPIDEEVSRYRELAERIAAHLPAEDPVRLDAIPRIEAGVAAFEAARMAVGKARTAVSIARTTLESAQDRLDETFEKTYGALVAQVGRRRAEAFFPRRHRHGAAAEEKPVDGGGAPA
jgi:hypothetical protein